MYERELEELVREQPSPEDMGLWPDDMYEVGRETELWKNEGEPYPSGDVALQDQRNRVTGTVRHVIVYVF